MKFSKIVFFALAAAAMTVTVSCAKNSGKVKIGIAKIVQHEALDAVENGVIDYLTEKGVDAEFDLQCANNDPNTAIQIAAIYKDEVVDVAVAIATPVAEAFVNSIKDIPIVFGTVTDPIDSKLVDTLDSGKDNVTGMCDQIPDEQNIAMFQKIAGIKTLGYIYCSGEANSTSSLNRVQAACDKLGIKLVSQAIVSANDVKMAAGSIIERVDGIYLTTDNTVFSALPSLIDVFNRAKKPIFSGDVTGAMKGGCVIASGFNYYKAGRATGELVYRILNGEKPADIPVRLMTEPGDMDLLFDLDEARNCGITIPEEYLKEANMFFENGILTTK